MQSAELKASRVGSYKQTLYVFMYMSFSRTVVNE